MNWKEKISACLGEMTQKEFAYKLGIDSSTLQRWFKGSKPKDDQIWTLHAVTGKPVSFFTGDPKDDADFERRYQHVFVPGHNLPIHKEAKPLAHAAYPSRKTSKALKIALRLRSELNSLISELEVEDES